MILVHTTKLSFSSIYALNVWDVPLTYVLPVNRANSLRKIGKSLSELFPPGLIDTELT